MITRVLVLGGFIAATLIMLTACLTTPFERMGPEGGYDDYPLEDGKYHITARGNYYTTPERVRDIAFMRAAELTQFLGKKRFFILEHEGTTTTESIVDNESMGNSDYFGNPFDNSIIYNAQTHQFQMTILPTDKENGIDAESIYEKYKKTFGQ